MHRNANNKKMFATFASCGRKHVRSRSHCSGFATTVSVEQQQVRLWITRRHARNVPRTCRLSQWQIVFCDQQKAAANQYDLHERKQNRVIRKPRTAPQLTRCG
jgi:hypothetical protein